MFFWNYKGLITGDAHFSAIQADTDYSTLKNVLDETFGRDEKKLLTLSGNWEYLFMRQFSRLNKDWYGMAWHWYPLGAGKSDDVIPNGKAIRKFPIFVKKLMSKLF